MPSDPNFNRITIKVSLAKQYSKRAKANERKNAQQLEFDLACLGAIRSPRFSGSKFKGQFLSMLKGRLETLESVQAPFTR